MPQTDFPLRWESTGDQWWYASPIDWAAANGHYHIVRELLHLDTNLLIKLTSLRRIRRLETVWDDDARFVDAAKCRAFVARNLLLECEARNRRNTLVRAGYGGWLLYTAASAGDMGFVQELLERDPLLVFGEGEYGVTDILYAAARSKNSGVFRRIFDFAVSPRCSMGGRRGGEIEEEGAAGGDMLLFRQEMMNRAVHAAARGGNLGVLKELLEDCSDVLAYRDAQGSTILHAAAGRGQVEVVKDMVASYDVINSRDNQGNTALHVAAFRGHLYVLEALISASPPLSSFKNNAGDTFLHMAVAGFRTPGFNRLDRQMELMKQLISGNIVVIKEIINIRNNDGRTALHVAMTGDTHSSLVQLLMTVHSINLNVRDVDGMTPLDLLLCQMPRSATSELLTKQLISAGGISSSERVIRSTATASQLKMQGIGSSPGTSFGVSDAEIFSCTGGGATEDSGRFSSCSSTSRSELAHFETVEESREISDNKQNSITRAATRLKILLRWPRLSRDTKTDTPKKKLTDEDSLEVLKKCNEHGDIPTPLRQKFSTATSLPNNKRTLSIRPKEFTMNGDIQNVAHPNQARSPSSSSILRSWKSSPASEKQNGVRSGNESIGAASRSYSSSIRRRDAVENMQQKSGFVNNKLLMNQYFCFGAKGRVVEDAAANREERSAQTFKPSLVSSVS